MDKIASGRRGLCALACLAGLFAYSHSALAQPNVNVKTVTKTLNSSAAHKECIGLSASQNLRYWFRADAPINFNVQYQEAGQVVYPVKKDKVSILSGTYSPKVATDVCIVWTNLNSRPVTLSFEFARLAKAR
jgi:uncharacterized protein (DUF2249 family)